MGGGGVNVCARACVRACVLAFVRACVPACMFVRARMRTRFTTSNHSNTIPNSTFGRAVTYKVTRQLVISLLGETKRTLQLLLPTVVQVCPQRCFSRTFQNTYPTRGPTTTERQSGCTDLHDNGLLTVEQELVQAADNAVPHEWAYG